MPKASPTKSAVPLCWWSASQLAQFESYLRPAWQRWVNDWAADDSVTSASLSCMRAGESPGLMGREWLPLGAESSSAAWVSFPRDGIELFGAPSHGKRWTDELVASVLARQAQADLLQALRACLGLQRSEDSMQPSVDEFKPWIGGVIASLGRQVDAQQLQLLVNARGVLRALEASPDQESSEQSPRQAEKREDLHGMEAALANRRVRLSVCLTACEINLGALSDLRVGDVVPMPHNLDRPLAVEMDGQSFCTGYLGRRGPVKALQLTNLAGDPGLADLTSNSSI